MKRWKQTLFGVVTADLVLRFSSELVGLVDLLLQFVVEVLGLGRTVGISAGAVFGTRLLLGLDLAGWVFGWLLFWLLLFWSAPLFFPRQGSPDDDWTAGLGNRLLLASATVGVGITIEGWLAAFETRYNVESLVSSPVFVPPVEAAGLLAVTLVGYVAVANKTTKTRVDKKYLYEPSDRYEGGTVTGDRYLLAVIVLGAILATMAVLFPLPELLLVSLQTADFLAIGVGLTAAEQVIAARNGLVEGMTGAVLSVWGDLREVFHLVYIVAPLLLFWVVAVETVATIAVESAVASSPLGLAVFGLCVLTIGVQVTFHSYRLSERVRDRLVDAETATEDEALNAEVKPRIPLVLIPAALAWFVLTVMIRRQVGSGETPSVISELPFEPELALLAVVTFVLSVLTVARPRWFPDFNGDGDSDSAAATDHVTAAVGTTLLILSAGVAAPAYTEPVGLPMLAAQVVVVSITLLSPWLAPRLLLGTEGSEWDRLVTGLKKAGVTFAVGFIVSLVIGSVFYLPDGEIPRRLYIYVTLVSLPWYVSGTAFVLFLFLSPFHYGSRGT